MHAECSFAHYNMSGYSLSILTIVLKKITEFMKLAARKKLHFLSIGRYCASMHDIEIPTQKKMYAHNGAPGYLLNKIVAFFQAPCLTNLMF